MSTRRWISPKENALIDGMLRAVTCVSRQAVDCNLKKIIHNQTHVGHALTSHGAVRSTEQSTQFYFFFFV